MSAESPRDPLRNPVSITVYNGYPYVACDDGTVWCLSGRVETSGFNPSWQQQGEPIPGTRAAVPDPRGHMTRKRNNRNWKRPQCDNCGRFIGKKDIADGTARRDSVPPGLGFSFETWVTLCKHCNAPTREAVDG